MATDVERGRYLDATVPQEEKQALLSDKPAQDDAMRSGPSKPIAKHYSLVHIVSSFVAGILLVACALAQYVYGTLYVFELTPNVTHASEQLLAAPYAGSTERHLYPPTSPVNVVSSLFPTSVGFAGHTTTGAEPAQIMTAPAYPVHTGAAQLVAPSDYSAGFDIFRKWGNLSPWYSVPPEAFGLDSGPNAPATCRVTGLHFLHRHGARYPASRGSYGSPSNFAGHVHEDPSQWKASGDLEFLNEWTYKLGEQVLTPFGRQQLFDLGVSLRLKYGFLLWNFTESNTLPVFRTESQDRMLASSMNFAIGFFGWPLKNKYQQSITIDAAGFNNTLSPFWTCPNMDDPLKAGRSLPYLKNWTEIYLKDAKQRFQDQLRGFELTTEDVYSIQQLCAYETVALGYSKFCGLFTEEEWEGFNYAMDLIYWYNDAFGSPLARVLGVGYINELVARLTNTPITTHNTSTNATLDDNPITFPLNQSLYVDATHEITMLNIITALNLSHFAASGPLPSEHIPPNRSFKSSEIVPFATNIQFQLLSCTSTPGSQIRIIINDGVVPLTGIKGCPEQRDGMCPVDSFVAAQQQITREADWEWGCNGEWEVPEGTKWNTTTGDPPRRPYY